jgi:glycosyltransferase involved in cell wall biosynthesis
MHILIIPSYYPSRQRTVTGIFFHEQAMALHKAGHQVGVLVTPRLNITLEALRDGEKPQATSRVPYFSEFPVYRMHLGFFPRPLPPIVTRTTNFAGWRAFQQYCAAHGTPDVIHAHNVFYGGALALHLKRKSGVPVVLTEHNTSYMEGLIIFPRQPAIIREVLRGVDVRLAVGGSLRTALLTYTPEQPIDVIGNVINTDFFTPADAAPPLSPFRMLTIGTLETRKAHDNTLRAFALACAQSPVDLRLHVVGDGVTRDSLIALAQTLNIADRVVFHGRQTREQVRDHLRAAHVLISSSLVESFGISMIEAMACGLPVISTRSGGPEDFVAPHTGELVPVGDDAAMATAMIRMRDHYADYDRAAIRAHVVARYSEPAIIARLEAAYAQAIAP